MISDAEENDFPLSCDEMAMCTAHKMFSVKNVSVEVEIPSACESAGIPTHKPIRHC